MNLFDALFLGIVQGLTEFLPVSSTGHLVLAKRLLGIEQDIAFDVLIHFATLFAVCSFFIGDIMNIAKAFIINRTMKDPYYKLGILIIFASIPTALIGFTFERSFEAMFGSLFYAGIFFMVTGALLLIAEKFGKGSREVGNVSIMDALVIGTAQGAAIIPSLSRSGATVSASLLLGLNRKLAARFSFLISIPAILGASAFKAKEIIGGIGLNEMAGFIAAALSGYLAILIFVRIIEKNRIDVFAYYCFFVGVAIFVSNR